MQQVCAILWRHLWSLWLHQIFRHYLINGTIFEKKKLLNVKCVFWFSLQLLSEAFLILRRIQRHVAVNVQTFPCKVPVIPLGFDWNLNFLNRFSKKAQISSFTKIRPVEAEFIHPHRRTWRSSLLPPPPRNFAKAPKKCCKSLAWQTPGGTASHATGRDGRDSWERLLVRKGSREKLDECDDTEMAALRRDTALRK
jgi:hypothetical protein